MTNKSTKRRNAVIAAVAGAALLLGGSTYALWSATANMDGGTIQSGNLAITAGKSNAWDVSQDRTDQDSAWVQTVGTADVPSQFIDFMSKTAHAIDSLQDWTMVPGDTVALAFPYKITLDGDNLVAQLGFSVGDAVKNALTEPIPNKNVPYLSMSYSVVKPATGAPSDASSVRAHEVAGGTITLEDLANAGTKPLSVNVSYFQAPNQESGTLEGGNDIDIPVVKAGGDVYVLVVYVTFSDQTPGQDKTSAKLAGTSLLSLENSLTATLNQVRCGTPDSNFTECQ